MSERQARIRRKNEEKEPKAVHKKSAGEIIANIIIVLIVIAVIALGVWAVASKFSNTSAPAADETQTEQSASGDQAQQADQTVAEYCEEKGITPEDFISQYGLSDVEGLTADSKMTDAVMGMTLENYAKLNEKEVSEIISGMGLDENTAPDTKMSQIYEDMMANAQQAQADQAPEGTEAGEEAEENETEETASPDTDAE